MENHKQPIKLGAEKEVDKDMKGWLKLSLESFSSLWDNEKDAMYDNYEQDNEQNNAEAT